MNGRRPLFLLGRVCLWAVRLPVPPPPAPPEGVVFRRAGPEDVDELARVKRVPPSEVLARMQAGALCYTGRIRGQLACYGWVSTHPTVVGEVSMLLCPGPSEAYIWDCATLPPFRRRGLYRALLRHILAEMSREGVGLVWIGHRAGNVPARRGIAGAGFSPVMHLTCLVLFTRHLCRMRPLEGADPQLVQACRERLSPWGAVTPPHTSR